MTNQGGCSQCVICKVTTLLVIVGALNWGLVAFANIDLVTTVFGVGTTASKITYGLVGLSGLLKLVKLVAPNCCPACKK